MGVCEDCGARVRGCILSDFPFLYMDFGGDENRSLFHHGWRLEGLDRSVPSLYVLANMRKERERERGRLQQRYTWRFSGEIGAGMSLLSRRLNLTRFRAN